MLVLCSSFTLCLVAKIGYTARVRFITVLYVILLDEIEFNTLNFISSHPTWILSESSCNNTVTYGLVFSVVLSTILTAKANGSFIHRLSFFPFTFIFQLVIPINPVWSGIGETQTGTKGIGAKLLWANGNRCETTLGEREKKGAKWLTCGQEKARNDPEPRGRKGEKERGAKERLNCSTLYIEIQTVHANTTWGNYN